MKFSPKLGIVKGLIRIRYKNWHSYSQPEILFKFRLKGIIAAHTYF